MQKVKDITDKEFLEGFEMDPIGVAVEILSSNEDLGLVEEDEVVEIPTTEDEGVAEKNRRTRNSGRLFIQGTSPTSKFMHNNTNDSKAAAEIIKGSIGKKEGVSDWLKTPGLLSEEAAALRFFLLEGFGIDEVASELGVSSIVAERYFNNAIIKIHLHSREKREAKEAKEARLGLDQD